MIYRFGAFTADTDLFELRRGENVVPTEPLVFNVLRHLLEHRDRIVTRDDLIEAVWQGRAVADTTLSSRIFALRQALGDSGAAQAVIRTVPRRGFRFVAEVACAPCGADAAAPDPAPAPDPDPDPAPGRTPGRTTAPAPSRPDAGPRARPPTLLILPFKAANAGADRYLRDGLTEDVIANLTQFHELRVMAGGTSFRLQATPLAPAELARDLGADFIVTGSARREAGRLRVVAHLIDGASGVSIWVGRFDRQVADIFAVQDEIARMIAAALGVQVQDTALTRALRKSPAEFDAYDCLLRARRYTSTLDDAHHAEARDLLERAVTLDPAYAEAHALLANVYLAEHRFAANPRPDPLGRALATALRATELNPRSAYARCWLAITHFFRMDNAAFQAEMRRAIDLNPNDPEILAEAGHYLCFMGDYDRGIELSLRARALNPLHPGWYHFSSARRHYHRGEYQKALDDIARVAMPAFYWSRIIEAAAFGQLGRAEGAEALAWIGRLKAGLSPADEMRKWNASAHDVAHLMEGLRKAGHDG